MLLKVVRPGKRSELLNNVIGNIQQPPPVCSGLPECHRIGFSVNRTSGSWAAKMHLVREDRSGWNCELLTPLPIPHPVLICLLIYNRHRDVGAIPLESESCRLLLRWLEGSATPSVRTKE